MINNFEQQFKRIDNLLRLDAGLATAIDYIEQTSWILFLKYIDDIEENRKISAELGGKEYKPILEEKYRFSVWATPKNEKGQIDYNKRRVNDDLINFVNQELFPYLKNFSNSHKEDTNTIEYKIGQIFSELINRIRSGKILADILDVVDTMSFSTSEAKHEMSALYEERIAQMGNSGRNGGEYYTPRPLIKTIVKVVDPKIGEKVYDGAAGSAGFLVEAFEHMKAGKELTPKENEILQNETFYGKELKALAYIIGIMNMILHGIEAPNIIHGNTLAEDVLGMEEKDRVDVILANPPFGAKNIPKELQENFPVKTGASELLFMQHFMAKLKAGGRAGIVIKNTFLSNTDNATTEIRKRLLEKFNLYTILDLPSGVFQGAGVKTVVLFFTKGEPTQKIWYYQLNLDRNLGKTNALNEKDLADFLELQKDEVNGEAREGALGYKKESENSWLVDVKDLDQETFDLSVKNPNKKDEASLRTPEDILAEIEKLDKESGEVLEKIKGLI